MSFLTKIMSCEVPKFNYASNARLLCERVGTFQDGSMLSERFDVIAIFKKLFVMFTGPYEGAVIIAVVSVMNKYINIFIYVCTPRG